MKDINSEDAFKNLNTLGYLDIPIPSGLNIVDSIKKLKEEKKAIILAHYYQSNEIQDIADYIGDSLGLAQEAEKTTAEIILFAGVHFMAETAKILNPTKKVLIPDLHAGCSLSDSCPADVFKLFKEAHPDHKVISYINCSSEIKALSDVICTSSNARAIVESFPKEQALIFAPDKNLGGYINKITGRKMLLWNGACMVHEIFSYEKLVNLKKENPNAKVIGHPECEEQILSLVDFIGSTTQLLNYTIKDSSTEFIVVTESGILHQMILSSPQKKFIPAPPNNTCACNDCPHMKRNTLEKIYNALTYEQPEIIMSSEMIQKAYLPIRRMLDISAKMK
ncbi:MAG: quinolinate synthase NadA [bacterium]